MARDRHRESGHRRGYILVEAVVAIVILSLGLLTVHHSMQQAILVRRIAMDTTQARFLLDKLIGQLEVSQDLLVSGAFDGEPTMLSIDPIPLYPLLRPDSAGGQFSFPNERFSYSYEINYVPVDTSARQSDEWSSVTLVPELVLIRATVSWGEGDGRRSLSASTLRQPDRGERRY